jgi:dTDP-4-amino-4,6-dideoxygalactose transaminase
MNLASQTQPQSAAAPLPGWPRFDDDEVRAATDVLRSARVNYWTGSEGKSFEREYAAAIGSPHAIALANGTVALELALAMLGVGAGDEVITTPRTFIASASCAVMRGARPVFADVDRDSQNITAATIERVISPRTRAIIPVHLAGWPCDMDAINALARDRGLAVIEDCAQANGATFRGRHVGTFGTFGAFSFCQDKIISTGGEGGLLVTADESLW